MAATEASELLTRFASGSAGESVCTPQGRAELRGAVRAYGEAMASGGVAWPTMPVLGEEPNELNSLDISVLVAFAAGFVESSDFRGPARGMLHQLAFAQWPEIRDLRAAARVACGDVLALQQAASRFVLETERLRRLAERSEDDRAASTRARLERQARRAQRAQEQMQLLAATVQAEIERARAS